MVRMSMSLSNARASGEEEGIRGVANGAAIAFYRSHGFEPYELTLRRA